MTDMQHKPNGWDDPLNQMTEEEWQEYFSLREKLDGEMTEKELIASLNLVEELLKQHKNKEAEDLMSVIPTDPRYAYQIKHTLGIKSVMYLNLSDAKKEFPNEF